MKRKTKAQHYRRNHENLKAGKRAEAEAERHYKSKGYTIKRAGWGQDFIASKKGTTKHVEVKQGESYMTKKQLRQMKSKRSYEVYNATTNETYNTIKQLEDAGLIRRTTPR